MPIYDTRVFVGGGLGGISNTVTSLPAGYTLGEERWEGGIKYRLFYNDKTIANVGLVLSPQAASLGPYSCSVSTTSGLNQHFGACVAHNTTVPASSFFWGAVQGYLASGLVATIHCLVTNGAIVISDVGSVDGARTVASCFVSGNVPIGIVTTGAAAGTVNVRQGSVFINLS